MGDNGMIDEGDDPQIVEVFARFGRAIYMANVVELALAQALLQVEFLTPAREKVIKEQGKNFDPKSFSAEFDKFMQNQVKSMMGTLRLRASQHAEFDDALSERILNANLRRNRLAHDYWRETGETFITSEGRVSMIDELSKDADDFERLAKDIRDATRPVREKLGVNEDELNERVENRLGELKRRLGLK
jgi:hypothetical protein